jgi:hypothetical protein
MRASWLILGIVLAAVRPAAAGHTTIVVMSDPVRAGELGSALQVALSGRGVAIASAPLPAGPLRLDRAAAAQRAAVELGADAALWIDLAPDAIELCAVSSDGRYFRHTPLPPEDSARAFAAIATSLVDELLAPPEAGFDLDMHVHVGGPGDAPAAVAIAPGTAAYAPPAPGASVGGVEAAVADPALPIRGNRTLLELGPMLSPVSAGVEAEVAFPISPVFRIGAIGGANVLLWDGQHQPVYLGALEIRRVMPGQRHVDLGLLGGAAAINGEVAEFAGLRIGIVWEHASGSTELSLVPVMAKSYADYVPGGYISLRWGLPI